MRNRYAARLTTSPPRTPVSAKSAQRPVSRLMLKEPGSSSLGLRGIPRHVFAPAALTVGAPLAEEEGEAAEGRLVYGLEIDDVASPQKSCDKSHVKEAP